MVTKEIKKKIAHKLPADLRKALISDPIALAKWKDITPLARNEWICWTISVKKKETKINILKGSAQNLKKEYVGLVVGLVVLIENSLMYS